MRRVAAAKWFGLVDRGRESSRPGAGATWPPVGGGPGHGSPGAAKAFHHECPSRVWRVIADDEKPGSIIDPGDGTAVCCRDYPTRPPRRPSRSRTGRRTLVAAEPRWWLQCMSALLSRPWPGRDAVATDASRVAARCGSPTFVPVEAAVVNRLAGPEPSRPTKRSLERMLWKSAVEEVGEPGGSGPCAAPDLARGLSAPVPDEPRGDRDAPPRLGPTGAARPATRSGSVLTESGCAERGGAGSGGHSVPSPCRRAPIATSGCYDSPGSMWLNRTACRREARSTTGWTSIASTRWRASSPTRAAGGGWSAGASEGWPARWRSRRRRSPTAARAGGTIAPSTASVAARPESRATPPPAGRRRWPPNRGSHTTA